MSDGARPSLARLNIAAARAGGYRCARMTVKRPAAPDLEPSQASEVKFVDMAPALNARVWHAVWNYTVRRHRRRLWLSSV